MPEDTQESQPKPEGTQKGGSRENYAHKGSSILARLRAGESVPGYYLDENNRMRKDGKQRPERVDPKAQDEDAMLAAMRHVCVNLASTDHTQLEKWARAWAEKKPDDFMMELRKMEAEAAKRLKIDLGDEEEVEPTEDDEALKIQITELIQKHAARAKK